MTILNPHSRLAFLYRYTYLKEVPTDGCDYFWKLLLAFFLFPLIWPAILFNHINERIWYDDFQKKYHTGLADSNIFGLFYNFIILIFGALVIISLESLKVIPMNGWVTRGDSLLILFYNVGKVYFFGLFLMVTIYYVAKSFVKFVVYIDALIPKKPRETNLEIRLRKIREAEEKKQKIQAKLNSKPSIFKLLRLRYKAYKDKNCPVLKWDYNNFKPK